MVGRIIVVILILCTISLARAQWVRTNGPGNVLSIGVSVTGDTVLAGTGANGIFRSIDNGFSWEKKSSGLPTDSSVHYIAIGGPVFFAGVAGSIYRSIDGGNNWVSVADGLQNLQSLKFGGGIILFAADSSLNSSTDNGNHWTIFRSSYQLRGIAASNENLIAATSGPMLHSSDQGQHWIPLDSAPRNVIAMATDGQNILAGDLNDIFYSHDNGTHWSHGIYYKGQSEAAGGNNSLAINGNLIMAAPDYNSAPATVWWSNNGGSRWDTITLYSNSGWSKVAIAGNEMFVGEGYTILFSSDLGSTWNDINQPGPRGEFSSFVACGPFVLAIMPDSIWRSPLSQLSVNSPSKKIEPVLYNFPNPFRQKTEIRFSCSERSFTIVSIYTLLGEEIVTLSSGNLDAGEHSFTWDASQSPAGMYECVVRMNGRVERIPMIVVR